VVQPADGVTTRCRADRRAAGLRSGPAGQVQAARTVDYVTELPRDPNGKLYKRRLRDPYWAASPSPDAQP